MFLSVITKNLDWEILTLKSGMCLRMRNFNIMRVHRKFWFLGSVVHEKPIYKGGLPKKGSLDSVQN